MLINIPEEVYSRLRELAETKDQPVEEMVMRRLKSMVDDPFASLSDDEQAELVALRYLSDDALWTIAAEQMPDSVQAQTQTLMDRNSRGLITAEEYQELAALVERGNRLMLRKAEAAGILMERGHSFTRDDFVRQHE